MGVYHILNTLQVLLCHLRFAFHKDTNSRLNPNFKAALKGAASCLVPPPFQLPLSALATIKGDTNTFAMHCREKSLTNWYQLYILEVTLHILCLGLDKMKRTILNPFSAQPYISLEKDALMSKNCHHHMLHTVLEYLHTGTFSFIGMTLN